MKEIILSRGMVALVDDENFDWLSQWKWSCSVEGYAVRGIGPKKARKIIFMHKQIMGFPDCKVDHKNMIRSDNQRHNLRECTHKQNLMNSGIRPNNTSGYKGVGFDKKNNKWYARIRGENSRHLHIGYFDILEDAATAYNFVAYQMHGEFAYMNRARNAE